MTCPPAVRQITVMMPTVSSVRLRRPGDDQSAPTKARNCEMRSAKSEIAARRRTRQHRCGISVMRNPEIPCRSQGPTLPADARYNIIYGTKAAGQVPRVNGVGGKGLALELPIDVVRQGHECARGRVRRPPQSPRDHRASNRRSVGHSVRSVIAVSVLPALATRNRVMRRLDWSSYMSCAAGWPAGDQQATAKQAYSPRP